MFNPMELNLNEQNSALYAGNSEISPSDVITERKRQTIAQKTPFLYEKTSQQEKPLLLCKATVVSQNMDREEAIPCKPICKEKAIHLPKQMGTKQYLTFDDIKHHLPSTKPTTNDTKIIKCRYPGCTAVGCHLTRKYCPDHFTQRYIEGEFNLPLPEHRAFMKPATKDCKSTGYQTGSNLVVNNVGTITISRGRMLVDGKDFSKNCSQTKTRKQPRSKKEKIGVRKGNPDIIESSGSDDEICYGGMRNCQDCSSTMCRSDICRNLGVQSYNWLCVNCHTALLQRAMLRISSPTPDTYIPKHYEETDCKCKCRSRCHKCRSRCHKCRSRCHKCRAHIEGGCYCAHCFHSNKESTDKDNTERMGAAGQFSRRHVLSSPADAHRLYQTHRDTSSRCRSQDGTKILDYCVARDFETDQCFTSLQPSDSHSESDEYVMSIGGDDFKCKYTHFPNDRG